VTNQVVATIDIGASPSDPFTVSSMPMSVAASDTAVWVTRYNSNDANNVVRDLLRIDPVTNTVVATIPLDVTPHFIALGEGALWVLSADNNAVLRVDTDTNQVVATISLSHPLSIAVGEGSVWVSNGPSTSPSGPVTRTVAEIDPATNTIVGTFGIDQNTIYIAAGAGAVWVDNGINNEVLRIDPETYETTARVHVVLGAVMTISGGMIWGHNGSLRTVTEIDPATNTIVATFPSGGLGGPIAVADGVIWIADTTADRVIRVDP
jgi:YVTN family beta-propeller protein